MCRQLASGDRMVRTSGGSIVARRSGPIPRIFLTLPSAFTFWHNAEVPRPTSDSMYFVFNSLEAGDWFQLGHELLLKSLGFLCPSGNSKMRTSNEQIRPPSVCVRLFALGSLSPAGVARPGPNRPGSMADPAVHHAHQSRSRSFTEQR